MLEAVVAEAWQQVHASLERFCLTAGVSALSRMMEQDAVELCGPRYGRRDGKAGHRWARPKARSGSTRRTGRTFVPATAREMALASWETGERKTCRAAGR